MFALCILFISCDSDNPTSTIGSSKKVLKSVKECNSLKGAPDISTEDCARTYYFNELGQSIYHVELSNDTVRGDSAYEKMVNLPDTTFVGGLGSYPSYHLIRANKKYDLSKNMISYVELYQYQNSLDTSYHYYFINQYWDGSISGTF